MTKALVLHGVTKRYGDVRAVDGLSFDVDAGEFLSLVGPSGCGKTTTLRMIAGFIAPDEGELVVDGVDIKGVPPSRRDMGMVYQSYALFPHMTVFKNIAYGLRMRKVPGSEIGPRVAEALRLVELPDVAQRYPSELSGGQQQRVALARAIVIQPRILLLDEPLSNLDARLRKSMQVELRELQKRLGITTIYVTHDQEEALTLSDRVVVMDAGTAAQIDIPANIYNRPANLFVARFIGSMNVLQGRLEPDASGRARFVSETGLELGVQLAAGSGAAPMGADVGIRPEQVELLDAEPVDGLNVVQGSIASVVYTGPRVLYRIDLQSGDQLFADQPNVVAVQVRAVGQTVFCRLRPDALVPLTAGGVAGAPEATPVATGAAR